MLLFDHDAALARWAGARLGIASFEPCTAIGVTHQGEIVAAAIYNNYRPPDIEITLVTSSPRWATRGAIRAMLRYPFVQLRCKRLTAVTAAQNASARAFLLRLGFRQEGIHTDALPTGDAVSTVCWRRTPQNGSRRAYRKSRRECLHAKFVMRRRNL